MIDVHVAKDYFTSTNAIARHLRGERNLEKDSIHNIMAHSTGNVDIAPNYLCYDYPCDDGKRQICHRRRSGSEHWTRCVTLQRIQAHLEHGDTCGPCDSGSTTASPLKLPPMPSSSFTISRNENIPRIICAGQNLEDKPLALATVSRVDSSSEQFKVTHKERLPPGVSTQHVDHGGLGSDIDVVLKGKADPLLEERRYFVQIEAGETSAATSIPTIKKTIHLRFSRCGCEYLTPKTRCRNGDVGRLVCRTSSTRSRETCVSQEIANRLASRSGYTCGPCDQDAPNVIVKKQKPNVRDQDAPNVRRRRRRSITLSLAWGSDGSLYLSYELKGDWSSVESTTIELFWSKDSDAIGAPFASSSGTRPRPGKYGPIEIPIPPDPSPSDATHVLARYGKQRPYTLALCKDGGYCPPEPQTDSHVDATKSKAGTDTPHKCITRDGNRHGSCIDKIKCRAMGKESLPYGEYTWTADHCYDFIDDVQCCVDPDESQPPPVIEPPAADSNEDDGVASEANSCKDYPRLEKGSDGNTSGYVRYLQNMINNENDAHRFITERLLCDGIFGPNTETAVQDWQRKAGLSISGVVDGPTWASLCPKCEGKDLSCPLDECIFTSPFGMRKFKGEAEKSHNGADYAANVGTPVYPALDGVVQKTSNDPDGYGNYIILEHTDGSETLYAHLNRVHVKEGQSVFSTTHTLIGDSGDTGTVTGPHLHFEYATEGPILGYPRPNGRIDPHPCVSESSDTSSTTVSVRDSDCATIEGSRHGTCMKIAECLAVGKEPLPYYGEYTWTADHCKDFDADVQCCVDPADSPVHPPPVIGPSDSPENGDSSPLELYVDKPNNQVDTWSGNEIPCEDRSADPNIYCACFRSCAECNSQSDCEWDRKGKRCSQKSGKKDTVADCACEKCKAFVQSQESFEATQWIYRLPMCYCEVVERSWMGVDYLGTPFDQYPGFGIFSNLDWDNVQMWQRGSEDIRCLKTDGGFREISFKASPLYYENVCCYDSNRYIGHGKDFSGAPRLVSGEGSGRNEWFEEKEHHDDCCRYCEDVNVCSLYKGNSKGVVGVRGDNRGCVKDCENSVFRNRVRGPPELDEELLDISVQAAFLCSLAESLQYKKEAIAPGPKKIANFAYSKTVEIMAHHQSQGYKYSALVVKSDERCYGAFAAPALDRPRLLAHLFSLEDDTCGSCGCCKTRHTGYTYFNEIEQAFRADLHLCLDSLQKPLTQRSLILTGHGAGGILTAEAGIFYAAQDPTVITFGQPPIIQKPCPFWEKIESIRFINSIIDTSDPLHVLRHDPLGYTYGGDDFQDIIVLGDEPEIALGKTAGIATEAYKRLLESKEDFTGALKSHRLWSSDTNKGYIERLVDLQKKAVSYPVSSNGWSVGVPCANDLECKSKVCGNLFDGVAPILDIISLFRSDKICLKEGTDAFIKHQCVDNFLEEMGDILTYKTEIQRLKDTPSSFSCQAMADELDAELIGKIADINGCLEIDVPVTFFVGLGFNAAFTWGEHGKKYSVSTGYALSLNGDEGCFVTTCEGGGGQAALTVDIIFGVVFGAGGIDALEGGSIGVDGSVHFKGGIGVAVMLDFSSRAFPEFPYLPVTTLQLSLGVGYSFGFAAYNCDTAIVEVDAVNPGNFETGGGSGGGAW